MHIAFEALAEKFLYFRICKISYVVMVYNIELRKILYYLRMYF